jgi:hypothetical protein
MTMTVRTFVVLAVAAAAAGCVGNRDTGPSIETVPPSANYKNQIAAYLRLNLTDREDFRGALISAPMLKPFGVNPHYLVCLRFNGRGERKDKVVVYLGPSISQYLDANPEQCGDAVFEPFKDLEDVMPAK